MQGIFYELFHYDNRYYLITINHFMNECTTKREKCFGVFNNGAKNLGK